MSNNAVEIEVTRYECGLILKYGLPFPDQADLFRVTGKVDQWHRISIDRFWLEQIVGELSWSMRKTRGESRQMELYHLCEMLDGHLR